MALASDKSLSRRALVVGTLGALGGLIGATMAGPLPVAAAAQSLSLVNDENNDTIFTAESKHATAALSGDGIAVRATSVSGSAVVAYSSRAVGVIGQTDAGTGLAGRSNSGAGVDGHSSSSAGVVGSSGARIDGSDGTTGVMGYSGISSPAVRAKTGVYGVANAAGGVGVAGASAAGRGGQFSGKKAQLRLVPSAAASHPSTGAKGDLFVDGSGRLWFYNGATWKRVSLV